MKKSNIDHFFIGLHKIWDGNATIYIVGGAGALLLGGVRPTEDIDFAISVSTKHSTLADSIFRQEKITGIKAQFTEDIDRWSMITYLDYRKHSRLYKKIGKMKIRVVEPEYWSIGKIARYLETDVSDMLAVFKSQHTNPETLRHVWQRALVKSPLSDALIRFKKQAINFISDFGPKIWGKSFSAEKWIKDFSKIKK